MTDRNATLPPEAVDHMTLALGILNHVRLFTGRGRREEESRWAAEVADMCHVWGDFYGPATSKHLARALAHRCLDRQGFDLKHMARALLDYADSKPALNSEELAAIDRALGTRIRALHFEDCLDANRQGCWRCRKVGGGCAGCRADCLVHGDRAAPPTRPCPTCGVVVLSRSAHAAIYVPRLAYEEALDGLVMLMQKGPYVFGHCTHCGADDGEDHSYTRSTRDGDIEFKKEDCPWVKACRLLESAGRPTAATHFLKMRHADSERERIKSETECAPEPECAPLYPCWDQARLDAWLKEIGTGKVCMVCNTTRSVEWLGFPRECIACSILSSRLLFERLEALEQAARK